MSYYLYDIINPFTVRFADVYLRFYSFIDPALAFLLFLSIASWVFKKKFGDKEGKLVAIGVSLALAFAFGVFEMTTGFFFGSPSMQGVAGVILMLIFGVCFYELLTGVGVEKACALAFSYIVIYATFMLPFSTMFGFMATNFIFLYSMLSLVFVVAFIATLVCLGKFIGGMFSGGHDEPGDNPPPNGTHPDPTHPTPPGHAPHTTPHSPPPDLTQLHANISAFGQTVRAFAEEYRRFQMAGEDALDTNHAIRQGRMPATNLGPRMGVFINHGNNLASILQQLRNQTRAISNDSNLGHLAAADAASFGSMYQVYFQMDIQMRTFWTTWQQYYANGNDHTGTPP